MNIQYREPVNLNELESLFRLRHTVYSEDAYLSKLVNPSSAHDINEFDLQALHYGAFDDGKPVAYIRIATASNTHFTNWVQQLLSHTNTTTKAPRTSYPFQSYYPDINWSVNFVSSLAGKKIGEVGRLAIHKDYRKAGTILFELISSFIEYCKQEQKIDTGFGSCTLKLARYYKRFGFTEAKGAKPFIYADLPEAVIVRFDK